MDTVESSLQVGALFAGRYSIERLIGMGGMGEVYLALDTLLSNEPVALKIIHVDLSSEERNVKRFLREAQLTRKVAHENIARTYDANVYDGRFYFSLEYLDGTVLSDLIKSGTIPAYEACRIVQQVCDGLEVIHKASIVHRDLKPGNLILVSNGVVKITDFGIARPGNSDLTKSTEVLGSAPYMAPELWTGGEVGSASDLYALGALMYEMLTGVIPLDGETAAEMMFKHLEVVPPRPSSLEKNIPLWLDEVVLKLLAKRPADRYQSAAEVHDALERGIKSAPIVLEPEAKPEPEIITPASGSEKGESDRGDRIQMYPYGGVAQTAVPPQPEEKLAGSESRLDPLSTFSYQIISPLTFVMRSSFALTVSIVLYLSMITLLEPYLVDLYMSAQLPSFRYLRVLATVGLMVTTGLFAALPLYVISSVVMTPRRGLSMLLTIITRLSISISGVLLANAFVFLASYAIDSKYTLGPYLLFIAQHVVAGMTQLLLLVPSTSMTGIVQQGNHLAINATPLVAISVSVVLLVAFSLSYSLYMGYISRWVGRGFRLPTQIGIGLALAMIIALESLVMIGLGLSGGTGVHLLQIGLVKIVFTVPQIVFALFNWALVASILARALYKASKHRSRLLNVDQARS